MPQPILMILVLLTFNPPNADGIVEITHATKMDVVTMDECKQTGRRLVEQTPPGKKLVVNCVPLPAAKDQPTDGKKRPMSLTVAGAGPVQL